MANMDVELRNMFWFHSLRKQMIRINYKNCYLQLLDLTEGRKFFFHKIVFLMWGVLTANMEFTVPEGQLKEPPCSRPLNSVRGPRRFVFLNSIHSNLIISIVKICRWIERSSGANDSQGVKLQMSSWLWSWLRWLAVLWWLWFSIGKSRLPILNETLLAKQGGFRKTIRKFCDFKQHGWTFVNNVRAISHHQSFKIPIRKTTNL